MDQRRLHYSRNRVTRVPSSAYGKGGSGPWPFVMEYRARLAALNGQMGAARGKDDGGLVEEVAKAFAEVLGRGTRL